MRPRLINKVRLPGMRRVAPASGLGWAVIEPAGATVSLFDHDLLLVARVATSLADPGLSAGATGVPLTGSLPAS